MNPKLSDDCRLIKTLFAAKDVLERYRSIVVNILRDNKVESIMDKCPIANFRTILRNILALGACINNSNQLRDWYLMVLEKMAEPAVQMGWTVRELEAFTSALISGMRKGKFDAPDPALQSYSKIVTTLSLSAVKLYPYVNASFVFGF